MYRWNITASKQARPAARARYLRVTFSLAASGAAAILMMGCSEESVLPTAPSPVNAAAPATASSASADGGVTAGLLEPERAQTALGTKPGDEAEDTLLAKAAASQASPPAKDRHRHEPPVESAVTNLRAETDEVDFSAKSTSVGTLRPTCTNFGDQGLPLQNRLSGRG